MDEPHAITTPEKTGNILWRRSESLIPYPEAIGFMEKYVQSIRKDNAPELIWSLEHPRLFTAGTSAKPEHLINPLDLPTYEAGRGGQWTYHGPGQRIIYLMLDLTRPHGSVPPRDLRAFVTGLEHWIMTALASFGISGATYPDRVGVWVRDPHTKKEAKIAAIGIRISRWVSWHGISLNVDPDLDDFNGIIPCGITEYGVTSLSRFHPGITLEQADAALARAWESVFETALQPIVQP